MKNLKQYSKEKKAVPEKLVRSVNIEKSQSDFLNKNNLNLSLIVRERLAELMKKGSK